MKEVGGGEPLNYEERRRNLTAKIESLNTESPVFQAFADMSDGMEIFDRYTRSVDAKGNHNMVKTMELVLVYETIRQRKNEPAGFKGYRAAFEYFQQQGLALETTPELRLLQSDDKIREVVRSLQDIKHKAIAKESDR